MSDELKILLEGFRWPSHRSSFLRRFITHRSSLIVHHVLLGLLLCLVLDPTVAFGHIIQDENRRAGTTDWQLSKPAVNREIEGYASLTSVSRGGQISFFINTTEPEYRIDIYRMGWYGGQGARLVQGGIVRQGVRQPMPVIDPTSGLMECDWTDPYVLTIVNREDPTDWMSGVYLAKLTAATSGAQSYIVFVVRDDARSAAYVFQSSVTTYQAYNNWGGKSLYDFNSVGGRARRVSFNRPYAASSNPLAAFGMGAGEFLTNLSVPPHDPSPAAGWEYNMVRWLEREGYDVTYTTNIDTHTETGVLPHKAWLSIGHDEYWTWEAREHVEAARNHGVGLAFFSANTCYWQIRLEPSPRTGAPYRTMVAYKDDALLEDPFARDADPSNDRFITVRWRDVPVNRPEASLIGVMYDGNPTDRDLVVINPAHWVFAGTGLARGDRLPRLLGYEADRVFAGAPPQTQILAESLYWHDGSLHVADMTVYCWPGGSLVFAAGTIQWSWGLDDFAVPILRPSSRQPAVEQITRNVLAGIAAGPVPSQKMSADRCGSADMTELNLIDLVSP